ncbi:hypothetical protein Tco_0741707 [Tanacetum coccineum]
MDQDSAHMVAASKVPMLKPGEYEIWRMRIEQYIQMIDYALWEVIENAQMMPDHTFDRLQKAVESVGAFVKSFHSKMFESKVIKSLSPKWNTHVVVWRNKVDLDKEHLDDLLQQPQGV